MKINVLNSQLGLLEKQSKPKKNCVRKEIKIKAKIDEEEIRELDL